MNHHKNREPHDEIPDSIIILFALLNHNSYVPGQ